MRKSIGSILMILLVLSVLISGCGSTATNQSPTPTPSASTGTSATPEPEKDLSGKYSPEITVTYARGAGLDVKFPTGQDYENNIWLNEYKSELGIVVDTVWTAEGPDAYETKLNMSIASGDLPDIFKCNAGQFQRLVEADMVENLTASVEKYASEQTKTLLQADGGEGIRQCTVGGELKGLVETGIAAGSYEFVFIRDDWRKNLNLPEPKTMEDVLNIAKAFTTQDPDQDGKADTYGLGISNKPFENYFAVKGFMNGYGAYPHQWIEKDGKLVYGSTQPEMKTALLALKKLYDEKLIDPEFIVKDSYKVSQDAVAGNVGMGYGQFWLQTWPLPDGYKADGADWTAYPIVFDSAVTDKGINAIQELQGVYVVRKGFSNPEALVKMYNMFLDRVFGGTADLKKYKNDGEHDIMYLAPVVTFIGEDRNAVMNRVVTAAIDQKDETGLIELDQKNTAESVKKYLAGDKDVANWTAAKLFYGPASVYGIVNSNYLANNLLKPDAFYGADTPEMVRRMSILNSSEEEMVLQIIIGDKPIEYFDEFVANWNKLGGETITFEVNQWRDSLK